MSRTIELSFPYSDVWSRGYLVNDVDGRTKVVLYNSSDDRSSTLYSRYLMSVKLGRFLTEDENVDHIDEDRFNDDVDNLQILTRSENATKYGTSLGQTWVEMTCPYCGTRYNRRKHQTHLVKKEKQKDFCSRSCAAYFYKGGFSGHDMNAVVFKVYDAR